MSGIYLVAEHTSEKLRVLAYHGICDCVANICISNARIRPVTAVACDVINYNAVTALTKSTTIPFAERTDLDFLKDFSMALPTRNLLVTMYV